MFNVNANVILLLIILSKITCKQQTSVMLDEERNNRSSNISDETRIFKNFVHSNILGKKVGNGVNSTVQLYNVTFTDINGQEVRISLNRTVIHGASGLKERAREDAYVKTNATENPYSVMVLILQDEVLIGSCTGSLLTREWVLTAAHCTKIGGGDKKADALLVYAGGYRVEEVLQGKFAEGSQVAKTTEFYAHPQYGKNSADADIAVVKAGPFNLTNTVNVVKLSPEPWTYHSYKECKFTGYGMVRINVKSKDDMVRKTHNLLMKNPCLCSFKLKLLLGYKQTERYICSKPQEDYGVCPGDSGGGLICDGQVMAVAMALIQMEDIEICDFTIFAPEGTRCGTKNTITIFQDTCPFLQYINSYVKLFTESEMSSKCKYTGSKGTKNPSCTFFIISSYIIFIFNIFIKS